MANNKRIAYYDLLNVISCFGVVCLHSNGYVHSFVKDSWWWLRVLVEVLFCRTRFLYVIWCDPNDLS